MNSIKYTLCLLMGVALVGCASGEPGYGEEAVSDLGASQESVTVGDCRRQVTMCVQRANSLRELGGCTAKFEACSTQAVADAAGQGNLLKECRDSANACLDGAITVTDIRACRSVLKSCVDDVATVGTSAVSDAIDLAKDAIADATSVTIDVIGGVSDVADGALDAVDTCSSEALSCVDRALTVGGVRSCRASFEKCLGSAIDLVDDAIAILPIPPVGQIASSLAPCQKNAIKCLSGAITVTDISACRTTLQSCVQGVTSVADGLVDEINDLLPGIVQIPKPGNAVDCTLTTATCLLKNLTPIKCAAEAANCIVH